MPKINPFKALRPNQEYASQVAELPYDVVSTEEAKAIAKNRPYSFFHVSRAEIDFEPGQDPHTLEVYQRAKQNLEKLIYDKALVSDSRPGFYVYQLKFQERIQTGIVALCSTDDYEKGLIKKHELTRQDKEDDRVKHIEFCGAHTGLVFLAYRKDNPLRSAIYSEISAKSCEVDLITADQVQHKIWRIDDPDAIQRLQQLSQKTNAFYIADGHHRAQAAWRVGRSRISPQSKYFIAGIFPEEELKILPYYRILKNAKGDLETLLQKAKGFSLKRLEGKSKFEPSQPHCFGIFWQGKWYEMVAEKEIVQEKDAVKNLDVYLLQEYFLKPVFGIKDPRTDENIDFMGGIRGVEALMEHCQKHNYLGITLYPTSLDEVMNVADQNLIMPPKSTWFEPKLRSGLFVNRFD